MGKYLSILWLLIGVWFLASSATENGLLPSGHGFGRTSEIVLGIGFIGYAIFRLRKGRGTSK